MATVLTASLADDVTLASEKELARLLAYENDARVTKGLLSGLAVFLGSMVVTLVSNATPYRLTDLFIQYGPILYLEVVGAASLGVGILYYAKIRRRGSRYSDLQHLVEDAKRVDSLQSRRGVLLELVNQMLEVSIPEIRRHRYDDAFYYGVLCFFLTAFLFPLNLIVAGGVWLYFRYEATSDCNLDAMRFDSWRAKLQV